ncbi:MAG TPA: DUF3025 domain-containing protein [Burkholderiales bacterium]|nr:DUF3025 domain-containing protein [Burkholderiales bacterium]
MKPSASLPWAPHVFEQSPIFMPLLPAAQRIRQSDNWPTREQLATLLAESAIVSGGDKPVRPAAPLSSTDSISLDYETRCYLTGELETREENWHDLFNALVWLTFPRAKAKINARHYHALQGSSDSNKRGPERDALTLFDECGVIVASDDASLLDLLRGFSWKELFWSRRHDLLTHMRVYLFGHGLYEQALQPYIGLTGKAVLLSVESSFLELPLERQLASLDDELAALIANAEKFKRTSDLSPLPILGVPGWIEGNGEESFYDNTAYFRPGRRKGCMGDVTSSEDRD